MKTLKIKILASVLMLLGSTVMAHGRAEAYSPANGDFERGVIELEKPTGSLYSCTCTQNGCNQRLTEKLHKILLSLFDDQFTQFSGGESDASQVVQSFDGMVLTTFDEEININGVNYNFTCASKQTSKKDLEKLFIATLLAYPPSSGNYFPPIPTSQGQNPEESNVPQVSVEPNPRPQSQVTHVPQPSDPENGQPSVQAVNPGGSEQRSPNVQVNLNTGGCSMGTMTEGGANAWLLSLFLTLPLFARILRRHQQVR